MTPRDMIAAIRAPEALAARSQRSQAWVLNFTDSLLARRAPLTDGQRNLLVKVYNETVNPAPKPAAPAAVDIGAEGIDGVRALFATAVKNGAARPATRLTYGGVMLRLSRAPDTGRNPGCIYVTDPSQTDAEGKALYLGAIQKTGGAFQPRRECTPAHIAALEAFGRDPAGVAAASGHLTGECTFCHQDLTDDRSKSVGYGPHCAAKYELPWGGSVPKLRRRAA
jgi:hypothetical protein